MSVAAKRPTAHAYIRYGGHDQDKELLAVAVESHIPDLRSVRVQVIELGHPHAGDYHIINERSLIGTTANNDKEV